MLRARTRDKDSRGPLRRADRQQVISCGVRWSDVAVLCFSAFMLASSIVRLKEMRFRKGSTTSRASGIAFTQLRTPSTRLDAMNLRIDRASESLANNTQIFEREILQAEAQVHEELRKVRDTFSVVEGSTRLLSPTTSRTARFAYAFVVGGCDPVAGKYRKYLYSIMVSTKILRDSGSQADFVLFVQMKNMAAADHLPADDLRILAAMGIQVRYIPKDPNESFYKITLEKFRILTLTEYERVMLMDADIVPRQSLDYLFDLSVRGIIRENLVFAGTTEPANAGLFMLKPSPGDYDLIQKIIHDTYERGTKLPYPHWDNVTGWGHEIVAPDFYKFLLGRTGKHWDFYCAFSDQGLLFHFTKYVKKSVTIGMRDHLENWSPNSDGLMKKTNDNVDLVSLKEFSRRPACWPRQARAKFCLPPYTDFHHFTGLRKPWLSHPPEDLSDENHQQDGTYFWFHTLMRLSDELDMNLDFNNWKVDSRAPLGLYPLERDAAAIVSQMIELRPEGSRVS